MKIGGFFVKKDGEKYQKASWFKQNEKLLWRIAFAVLLIAFAFALVYCISAI